MERIPQVKGIQAIYYPKGVLANNSVDFLTESNNIFYNISITDNGYRTITLSCNTFTDCKVIYILLENIEKLLSILEGCFLPLEELKLLDPAPDDIAMVRSYEANLKNIRCTYFTPSERINPKLDRLVEYANIDLTTVFPKWLKLKDDLGVILQMYFYCISKTGISIDVTFAFLIELSESFYELFCDQGQKESQNSSTPLKVCLTYLIKEFGSDIFVKENDLNEKEKWIQCLVNSRVNIMHIKRNYREPYLDGKECQLYYWKLCVLYRTIMMRLLGIYDFSYKISSLIAVYNSWDGVLDGLIRKLQS